MYRLLVVASSVLLLSSMSTAQTAVAPPADKTVSVSTAEPWTDSGIDLKTGDVVNVSATAGEGQCNPQGQGEPTSNLPVPTAALGALIAKLSAQDASPVLVGSTKLIPVSQPGHLFLGVNSTGSPPCSGSFSVRVKIGAGSADGSIQSKLANAAQIWMSGQFGNTQPASTQPTGTQSASAEVADGGTASNVAKSGAPLTPVKPLAVSAEPLDPNLAEVINGLPRRVNDEFKNLGDMTNFVLVGSEEQVKSAFEAAEWHIADLDTKQSIAKAILLTMQKQDYMTMPMSQLYLFDRVQDYGYEQGEAFAVVASRHHFRIWKAPFQWNGQDVWIGAGTHDIGFEKDKRNGKVTHKIDPAVDGERDHIGSTLQEAGKAKKLTYYKPSNAITEARNATGGGYHSDGRTLVIFLE